MRKKYVLRNKRDEITGGLRKLYNKLLHTFYHLNQIKEEKWTGYIAHARNMRNLYTVLIEKSQGKRPGGKPMRS
jgi:hypothetical protein